MDFNHFNLKNWTKYFHSIHIDSYEFLSDIEKNLKEVISFVLLRDNSSNPTYEVDETDQLFKIYFQINLGQCSPKMKECVRKKFIVSFDNIRNLCNINVSIDTITLYSKDLFLSEEM
jgi:hypothetical protein